MIKNDRQQLENFFKDAREKARIASEKGKRDECEELYMLAGEARTFLNDLPTAPRPAKQTERVAATDFGLDTPLVHTFDLDRLYEKVKELFQWYNTSKMNTFMAPYFPVIQSSGMGKTKLCVELKRLAKEAVVLLECKGVKTEKKIPDLFTGWFNVYLKQENEDRIRMCNDLDLLVTEERRVRKDEGHRVIIIFDEAQLLLENDGWAFRCVRWWLRHPARRDVVAIFSGTTSSLANFFKEPPEATTSRDGIIVYRGGKDLYAPFYDICSIGIFGNASISKRFESEYENAVLYGRPLFALLQLKDQLTVASEMGILTRMLLGHDSRYVQQLSSCYSILGTRVQLGHVTFELASAVTSRGYAGLTYFSAKYGDIAHNCFFPDPVCARLAMGMTIEGLEIVKGSKIGGRAPMFWMRKATELFSYGICRPAKGDIAEIACALYLLFCGDRIRYAIDKDLKQFSVPLDKWVSLLLNPNQEVNDVDINQKPIASVSCVQVCSNYLRHTLKQVMPLLPHWYQSGRAMYTCTNCRVFDLIVPVRYPKPGAGINADYEAQFDYCPLLVSVKNQQNVSSTDESKWKADMEAVLENEDIKTGLCMLLLVGVKATKPLDTEYEDIRRFRGKGVYSFTVVVDSNDPFGVSDFLETASTGGGEHSEIYVSHSEALFTPLSEEIATGNLLRQKCSDDAFEFLQTMREKFNISKKNKRMKYS